VNRALWLSGLIRFVGARGGTVLLKVPSIESEHKLAANRVGVALLSQNDFAVYDQAKVFPGGSSGAGVTVQDLRDLRDSNGRFERLRPLLDFLYRDAWEELQFRFLIRRLVGFLRGAAGEFDPAKLEHHALLCDAAAILSIGLAECTGRIFQNYLQPEQKDELANHLRLLMWGGREQYDFVRLAHQRIQEAKGVGAADIEPLDLSEWNSFLQLVRSLLDQPSKAFDLPWLLRQYAVDVFRGKTLRPRVGLSDLVTLKQAMLVLGYVCKAAEVPKEFEATLTSELVGIQAVLVNEMTERKADPR
jgi:hypothetical protein